MKVLVSLGSLHQRHEEALQSLREDQPNEMKAILDAAAAEERATHAYDNRTGEAEASTEAGELTKVADLVSVEFGMGVDYATYLDRRGLTRIVELAEEADTELQYYFEGERDRIAGL